MISVVIPSYNRANTIKRAVESVLEQTYTDLEVIVVDDCSDDDTEAAVSTIGDLRVRYERLDKRSGACVARNRGIEVSHGEYIAFQDSDDKWLPGKLEIQLKAMTDNDADVCFCRLKRHYTGKDNRTVLWPESLTEDGFMDHVRLRRRSYASTQTIIARRHVFDDVLFDPGVVKSQDYDWMIRASRKYRTYYVSTPLVDQYLQPDSISIGYDRFVTSRQYLLDKYKDLCEEDPEFKLHLLKQLAHYKSLAGMNAVSEYKIIWSMEKSLHNAMCVVLSAVGLMKVIRSR